MALDTSYRATIRRIAPVVPQVIEALRHGTAEANDYWAANGFGRGRYPHLWPHLVRTHALERLASLGVTGEEHDDENAADPPMSAVLVTHGADLLKVRLSRDEEVPVPGASEALTAYYRQHPQLPGMETNNLLLLWRHVDGHLVEPLTLVRPANGGRSTHDTIVTWKAQVDSSLATMKAADLDELRPVFEQQVLGNDPA